MTLAAINWEPSPRQLRQFALAGAALLVGAALWPILTHRATVANLGLLAAGIGLAGFGRWRPRSVRYLYFGLTVVTFPIGWLVSHTILATVYFGVFAPVALFFRLIGRDALQRRFAPAAATYWQPRRANTDLRRYFRQY